MSFALTTGQILLGTKLVTRRIGWANLKPGEQIQAVEKGQGLKKGEKVRKLRVIECVSNRPEPLDAITPSDVILEGFPGRTPGEFVAMFCLHNNCTPHKVINRIEFKYIT